MKGVLPQFLIGGGKLPGGPDDEADLAGGYPELLRITGKCRFQDCRHTGELGCRIEESGITEGRLARYREFLDIILVNSKKYGK